MTNQPPTVAHVILPLDLPLDGEEGNRWLRLTAAVLADWFDAPLQIVTRTRENLDWCQEVSAGAGVPTNPVVDLSEDDTTSVGFFERLGVHCQAAAPALCVVSDEAIATALIEHSDQPIFIARQPENAQRIGSGPLVVPISGHSSDLDSLAIAAAWSHRLGLAIRLVTTSEAVAHHVPAEHERLLQQMGLDVGIDRVTSPLAEATLDVASTRRAAAVIAAERWAGMPELLVESGDRGVSVVLAPSFDYHSLTQVLDLEDSTPRPHSATTVPSGMTSMPQSDCQAKVNQNTMARLGYVDHGWPVVVPVNYSTAGIDLIIRSLPGGKLDAAERGDVVCLELDGFDDDRTGWSVLVHGRLELITDPALLRTAWEADPDPWVSGQRFEWLRLTPLAMTGRKVEQLSE